MTSAPSPPNRRRRSIVVTIAVLVLGLGWWFWPRVDQRFVGKWRMGTGNVMELRANGFGTFHGTGGVYGYQAIRWSSTNDRLFLATWVPYWHQYVFHLGRLILGQSKGNPLEIVGVESD